MHDLDKAIRAAMMTAHRYARGGYADGGDAESVLMQDKLNAPNQWLQFGGQDMQAPPAGLPIGQAVGTSLGYHGLEGLAGGAELTQQAIQEGRSPDMSNPETAEKVLNAAGLAQLGGFGVPARAGETVLGSGPVIRQAVEMAAQPRELSPLGFYSHGAETAAGLQQAKGTPQQYYSMLEKSGVKPVELEGFNEAFAGKPSVTREEIAAHFKERMPQIEETVLGGRGKPEMDEAAKQKWIEDQAAERAYNSGDIERIRDWRDASNEVRDWHLDEATSYFNERMATSPDFASQFQTVGEGGATKFQQYTLPGGENYREVLLKMPSDAKAPTFEQWYEKTHIKPLESYADDPRMMEMFRNKYDAEVKNMPKEVSFKSSHWDDPNVLAHLRMADRTGPNGEKILHVEEIQSDWGQKGKKAGFITPETTKQIESINQKITDLMGQRDNLKDQLKDLQPKISARSGYGEPLEYPEHYTVDLEVGIRKKIKNIENEVNDLRESRPSPGLPSAPYVTNTQAWTDLALKRALREAAEGGYDRLVWTPGAEQAKRYKLSNHVNSIDYMREGEDAYRLGITNKQGEGIDLPKDTFTAKELEEYLGKEVAQKIVDDEGKAYRGRNHKTLEGLDLEVGGKGMKGYYDKIVPTQLSKLVKKLDPEAKVGVEKLAVSRGNTAIIESDLVRSLGISVEDIRAMTNEQRKQAIQSVYSAQLPSLTITPKMREAIMKGQTAYAQGGTIPFGPEAAQRAVQIAKQQAGRR